jgi:hypothetical protein
VNAVPCRSIVATWYYEQEATEGGEYAQMRGDSSSEAFRDVYRRCVAVFFTTARIANPDAELVLVLNRPWRSEASAVARDVRAMLERAGVELRVCPYSFAPPSGWPTTWRNQFFVFDALEVLAAIAASDDAILLLDSDIVWSGSERTAALWDLLLEAGSLTIHMDYEPERDVNGLTRSEMTRLAVELGLETGSHDVLPYSGGELVGLTGAAAGALCARALKVWPGIITRFEESRLRGMEEAHLLSMLYADLGLVTGNAAPFIKRLWTQPLKYRNRSRGDEELALWHVPAEKRYGLSRLYEALASGALDPSEPTWARPSVLGRYVGVPRNCAQKVVQDVADAVSSRVLGAEHGFSQGR